MQDLSRPDWDLWFMRIAFVTAQRGSCRRKRVGALVVRDRDRRIISGGYNGAPRGMPDCLTSGCDVRVIDGRESCVRTLHAESNAIDLAGSLAAPHTLYTTVVPCRLCALRVVQSGIRRVVYQEYYESQGTREVMSLFKAARVQLDQLNVPDHEVRPLHMDIDFAQAKVWDLFTHIAVEPVNVSHVRELVESLCHALGVSTEPDK